MSFQSEAEFTHMIVVELRNFHPTRQMISLDLDCHLHFLSRFAKLFNGAFWKLRRIVMQISILVLSRSRIGYIILMSVHDGSTSVPVDWKQKLLVDCVDQREPSGWWTGPGSRPGVGVALRRGCISRLAAAVLLVGAAEVSWGCNKFEAHFCVLRVWCDFGSFVLYLSYSLWIARKWTDDCQNVV